MKLTTLTIPSLAALAVAAPGTPPFDRGEKGGNALGHLGWARRPSYGGSPPSVYLAPHGQSSGGYPPSGGNPPAIYPQYVGNPQGNYAPPPAGNLHGVYPHGVQTHGGSHGGHSSSGGQRHSGQHHGGHHHSGGKRPVFPSRGGSRTKVYPPPGFNVHSGKSHGEKPHHDGKAHGGQAPGGYLPSGPPHSDGKSHGGHSSPSEGKGVSNPSKDKQSSDKEDHNPKGKQSSKSNGGNDPLSAPAPTSQCVPATYACAMNPKTGAQGWQVCDVTGHWVVSPHRYVLARMR